MITLLCLLVYLEPIPAADDNVPHGVLTFKIVDSEDNPIPARLTFMDTEGSNRSLFPNPDAAPSKLALRKHAVYTLDGHGSITVPVGKWDVMASHGIEWSIDTTHFNIVEGETYEWNARLEHEIDTSGWISGDFHLHTLTYSGHGDSNMNERIISIVGEGVEFAVATDHNHNTDYQPIIDQLGANKHLTAVVGNEVSARYGHLNAFPLDANAAVVDQSKEASDLFSQIRAEKNAYGVVPIIQINHPRWENIDYFGKRGLDPVTGESKDDRWSWDFDCIEVLNENEGWGFNDAEITDLNVRRSKHSVLRDWYNMLNAGRSISAVGNSDSHAVISCIAGIPRNYVFTGNDDASNVSPTAVANAIRTGRMSTTTGPFIRMTVNGHPMGSTISISDPVVDVYIDAQAASWIDLDTIRIIQNGEEVAKVESEFEQQGVTHFRPRIRIASPRDCWIIAIAEGDQEMTPYLADKSRPIYPLAIANPVYVDADGDGLWTPPTLWAEQIVEGSDLEAIVELYNKVNPTEQNLLVLASAKNPAIAQQMIRLGLSSDERIVKLAACRAATELNNAELLSQLSAVIDHPDTDRYLGFSAWAACDSIDQETGKLLLKRLADRFGWENVRRYTSEYPALLPGNFIREWQVAGYFAITNDADRLSNLANQKQIPEPNIMSLVVPTTITGEPLSWKPMEIESNGYLNLSLGDLTENTICYARCWLWSPNEREVYFSIGSDDACRIWVDEELVWDDPNWQTASKDSKIGSFTLKKGWNPVLFKILNGLKGMGLYFRVMDEEIESSATEPRSN
ncbi:MAG: CehA/McbA family metallohydrolase [Planctomycetota bacterium]|nr:CehA/McbA family metallohydrolase [Planctomycetota bacterium]